MSDKHHEEGHTGPIKNSKQLLITVVLAFILPVILIIGLVNFVGSAPKTGAGVGMHELAQAQRIQKIGSIEIRDANRPLRGGEDVYKGQCAACHATGVSGAPKFGDAAAWAPRLGQGFEVLVQSALKGKNAMAPQGGGEFNDLEISRAVAFMANAGGANFPEPQPEAKEGDAK
ncbi:c-type cytochrome [Comamonas jiangduensis]|jgi:cytochrome c5|uniref:c-type cytochrome n=1 Tax=Comamonas jiangduensis TaxID=1194168 RepID=UPI001582842D|nr:c-type cytochrome [Comamonas jiangduensis]